MDRFRKEVADWLEVNCPDEMRQSKRSEADTCWGGRQWAFASEAQRFWLERMAARGWTVPTWPREYGGGGLSPEEAAILQEEMDRIGARAPLENFGISMLGPALLKFGNEAQKREHLPKIARGEIRWCQGYSEPGAGSDLASLRTRAVDNGDHFLVNGQKIWTSYADKADWIFCLVRTDPDAKKQQGISFLLFDMETPGVTARPIRLISGKSPFCETFLEDVRVPKENLVGELNRGWDVAKYLLTHEREMIASGGSNLFDVHLLDDAAAKAASKNGELHDKLLRARIAEAAVDTYAFEATRERYIAEANAGREIGARSAVLKYQGTELNKRRLALLMSLGGVDALAWDENLETDSAAGLWLRSRGNSIEGGTSEIMLEIISKSILQLPTA
ncbi:acyl-CoA dehydrogenase (plasmid) [Microvirga ossetica]|uniref:Acyl-CoA dehydrogenase n=1 Tax=Microvirga ossetica TaxID=1882682 RepID=A0A1B2EUZ4_9HYPH|nr:acyl-CoA dehydrogenase family protein [Microvirga ossetica]ANY83789.1 acyl-CoA dehydrogenase [Microvirga ossetica]